MKNPTILSLTPARSLQMSTLKMSTFRIDQPRDWKCYKRICGEVSSFEAKDSSEGNYRGQGKGFTTGSLYEETRFPQVDLLAGLENDFNFGDQPVGLSSDKSFATFWPAKWLKRNLSMLSTGKHKFVCRRDVIFKHSSNKGWKSLGRSWNYFIPELIEFTQFSCLRYICLFSPK